MSMTTKSTNSSASLSRDTRKTLGESAPARPSSSVIVVSPSLEILLLHRVQTSSSFPSAHVFPGGNIDKQDGHMPEDGIGRHQDNHAYRMGALRELFEESGLLLARQDVATRQLLSVSQAAREVGRKLVHSGKVPFQGWLNQQSPRAVLDTDGLIPFSRWVTPPNLTRRFTTQMYIYILPSDDSAPLPSTEQSTLSDHQTAANPSPFKPHQKPTDFIPTPDGNLENTSATFSPAHVWLSLAKAGTIVLFPPQFLLLHLISRFLDINELITCGQRIQNLKDFIYLRQGPEDVSWTDKCISPYALAMQSPRLDGKVVLGLDKPGPEVEGLGSESRLRGDRERVVLVKWTKEGPRQLEVRWRSEVMEGNRNESRSERVEKTGRRRAPKL